MSSSRVSTRTRRKSSNAANESVEENDNEVKVETIKETKKRKGANKKISKEKKTEDDDTILSSIDSGSSMNEKKKRKTVANKTKKKEKESKPKKAKIEPQRLTEKDELTKLWDAEKALNEKGSYSESLKFFFILKVLII